jgi:cytochrome bd-type quinol oxidase subunit 2
VIEALLELFFEFFGELLLQLLAEFFGAAFKTGWYKVTGRERGRTLQQEVGWAMVSGIIAGVITVALFPVLAIRAPWLQLLNLLAAPVAAGLLVERVRAWRESRAEFSRAVFGYAALFGLMFALTRWLLGH